jgi:hypothetical protein
MSSFRRKGSSGRSLSIDVHESIGEESFLADGDVFIKDNLAIDSTGIMMRNNPKKFRLVILKMNFRMHQEFN